MTRQLSIKNSYLLALGIILLLAVLKYISMEILIKGQDQAAVIINVSDQQRMLSQRTALFTLAYATTQSQAEKNRIRPEVLRTLNEFENNHQALIYGDSATGLPPLKDENIYDIYFNGPENLDNLMTAYIANAHAVINNPSQAPQAQAALEYIIETGPNALLKALNDVVKAHEQRTRADVQSISNLHKIFLVTTILILFLEGLFLFRPMARRIEKNIEELKKREQTIKNQFDELERFTHIASHDLHEPLRKIIGFTERLNAKLDGTLDDKGQTYMDFIMSGAFHMRDLVRGLQSYARISAEKDNLEKIDTNKVVKQALRDYEEEIEATQATISYDDLPSVIYNRSMLIEVFQSIISNALKYKGANNPIINITAHEDVTHWVFCISDNGLGVDEKYFERIFSMFQRLHRKEDIPGIGLGLAIAKKIIERHGGEISIQSQEDKGSEFFFTIPKMSIT